MSLFSFEKNRTRVGAIVDIGSGSVLVAIVVSKSNEAEPTIVWSHREEAPLRHVDSITESAKSVLTSLVNALLKFDSEGRRALYEFNKSLSLSEIQVTLSAPWSYTVAKSINYKQETDFKISNELVEELVRNAEKKIKEELGQHEEVNKLGLTVVARTTMDTLANGYRIKRPQNQTAKELVITHASVVTEQYFVDELEKLNQKLFSELDMRVLSYILGFYIVSEDLLPAAFDKCLVDITYEATEIGIVREGSLRYATHTPFGSFSLAREISTITGLPLHECFQHLHDENFDHFLSTLTDTQRSEVTAVFDAYTAKLVEIFKETGDELSIPKQILLHADLRSEPVLRPMVENAARSILKADPIITTATPAILKAAFPTLLTDNPEKNGTLDTGMLLSALFFHKQGSNPSFDYL
jgi:cell division ATPase FtsA